MPNIRGLIPALLLLLPVALAAQAPASLVERRPCAGLPSHAQAAARSRLAGRPPLDSARYERLRRGTACERLTYLSDGLRVVAILVRPSREPGRPIPVLLYAHGGSAAAGALPEQVVLEQARWVEAGFLFLAPQFRGGGGSEGTDEVAGAVRDLVHLGPALRDLGYADTSQVFVWGHSRGGTIALGALRDGFPARSAAVTGARGDSAVGWAERIGVPLLILHGEADAVVPVASARLLAGRLQALGHPHELVIYPGGDHGLDAHRDDVRRRMLRWFRRYRGR